MGDNRVLNFSEFADKYSVDGDNELGIDDMSTASDAFVDGFDQDSYEGPEIKPNRPVGGEDSITPPGPGEEGSANFSSFTDSGMEAPGEEEELIDPMEPQDLDLMGEPSDEEFAPVEGEEKEVTPQAAPPIEADEDGGDPEKDDESDDESEDEKEDESEDEKDDESEDDDESDDDKKEDTNESVKGLLESFDYFTNGEENSMKIRSRIERNRPMNIENIKMHDHGDNEFFVVCAKCKDKKTIERGEYPFGTENEMNKNSWWQGSNNGGMQCGC